MTSFRWRCYCCDTPLSHHTDRIHGLGKGCKRKREKMRGRVLGYLDRLKSKRNEIMRKMMQIKELQREIGVLEDGVAEVISGMMKERKIDEEWFALNIMPEIWRDIFICLLNNYCFMKIELFWEKDFFRWWEQSSLGSWLTFEQKAKQDPLSLVDSYFGIKQRVLHFCLKTT